ncbi:hypothetical protein [Burkholderia sp. RF2-non_BP3]|uniref:hypothetical protein n=1 Tax=Burkholderia sp. RF2-non_BP3 TaxID=1637844 RepID=UPI00075E5A4F|nr:hypothetical protein [Burkholderia sp. RF2-non_BP3]KUY54363.1 hypothetical protein WS45_21020 [Burkholderia sp. RF2-non_BP3]
MIKERPATERAFLRLIIGVNGVFMAEVLSWIAEYPRFFVSNPVAMLLALAVGAFAGYWFRSQVVESQLKARDNRIAVFAGERKRFTCDIDSLKVRLNDAHKRLGIEPHGTNMYAAPGFDRERLRGVFRYGGCGDVLSAA